MLPRVALLPSDRAMLVPMRMIEYRLSSDRKLSDRKSGASTAVRNHGTGSAVPAGGRLLEWHCAQFSAKARRPVLSVSADAERYWAPPGASFSKSGFISFRKLSAFAIRASVRRQSSQFLRA